VVLLEMNSSFSQGESKQFGEERNDLIIWIIVASVIGIFLLCASVALCLCCRKRSRAKRERKYNKHTEEDKEEGKGEKNGHRLTENHF
jgi:heme/copper-type cytochrome/quinol oxidase subunit 2